MSKVLDPWIETNIKPPSLNVDEGIKCGTVNSQDLDEPENDSYRVPIKDNNGNMSKLLAPGSQKATSNRGLRSLKDPPMSWISDELEEQWISEPENIPNFSTENDDSNDPSPYNLLTTRINERVSGERNIPEWHRALNQISSPSTHLEKLFIEPKKQVSSRAVDDDSNHEDIVGSSEDVSVSDVNSYRGSHSNSSVDSQIRKGTSTPPNIVFEKSQSPLKIFQKHDTYTNTKFEGLLGSMGSASDTNFNTSSNEIITNTSQINSTKPGMNMRNNIVNAQSDETHSISSTYDNVQQDYIHNADIMMEKLRELNIQEATEIKENSFSYENDNDMSYNSDSSHEKDSFSAAKLENSPLLSSLNPDQPSHHPLPIIPSTNSIASIHTSRTQSYRSFQDGKEALKLSVMKRPRASMAFIGPEDVKDILPDNIGSMGFDKSEFRWKRNVNRRLITSEVPQDLLNSRAKKNEGTNSDTDIFAGIDDLSLEIPDEQSPNNSRASPQYSDQESVVPKLHQSDHFVEQMKFQLKDDVPSITNSFKQSNSNKHLERARKRSTPESERVSSDRSSNLLPRHISTTPSSQHHLSPAINTDSKREVSFKTPISRSYTARYRYTNATPSPPDITNISQINTSYSEQLDALVKALTECAYEERYWDQVEELDLSSKRLDSLLHLFQICPSLTSLNASDNKISLISGVPTNLRILDVSHNELSDLTSFGHIINLQCLNLAFNSYKRLTGLSNLIHLRVLDISHNELRSLESLAILEGLIRLNASDNVIESVDFSRFKWPNIENLDLSRNNITEIQGLSYLVKLIDLNIDDNHLSELSYDHKIRNLRRLSIRKNKLRQFSGTPFGRLMVLHLDENSLVRISGCKYLKRLEELSFSRQQLSPNLDGWERLTDIKKLSLSENRNFQSISFEEPYMNLTSLDLSGIGLEYLPNHFSEFMINLRELNLSFNNLKSLGPIGGIPKLKRLYLFENKISSLEDLLPILSNWVLIRALDIRENPISSGLYLDVISSVDEFSQITSNPSPALTSQCQKYKFSLCKKFHTYWKEHDAIFLQELADHHSLTKKRKILEGLVFSSIQHHINDAISLKWLNGRVYTNDERMQRVQ